MLIPVQYGVEGGSSAHCLVLLAAYNGLEWIDEQIQSILNQVGVEVNVVVSVDFSEDRTFERCLEWAASDSRVTVLNYGERFGGAARNFFRLIRDVDISGFDVVAFADQDDIWLQNKLLRAWKRISNGECDVYSSDVLAFWPDGKQALIKKSDPQRALDHFYEAAGPGCTYVFRAEVFQAIRDFVINRFTECKTIALHDWLIYAYCRQSGYCWLIDDEPLMLYRQHLSNQVGTNNNFVAYRKRLKMVKEGWYLGEVRKIANLVAPQLVDKLTKRRFIISHFGSVRRRLRDRIVLLVLAVTGLL
ncbi:Glycosyl transferase family 2 [Marinobacterium sp. xm-a-121]|uniref:glycosyltransferase n=1 Tax=unclassified Marinobacterium TaxID=2644139 RepID=UPI00156A5CCA|nr:MULTISPECIES: glycosyltransferase [unclassified Marinobacterium]NRP37554.1 Glycosyl transferase family 2 [Marinobacterium sp. xm-a-121]NRP99898.1 Glycosyl transferase family 2 [Marinobacterium sp. xm-v-233]